MIDSKAAQSLGINGTPAFLVGRRLKDGQVQIAERLTGVASTARFGKPIEKAMKLAGG